MLTFTSDTAARIRDSLRRLSSSDASLPNTGSFKERISALLGTLATGLANNEEVDLLNVRSPREESSGGTGGLTDAFALKIGGKVMVAARPGLSRHLSAGRCGEIEVPAPALRYRYNAAAARDARHRDAEVGSGTEHSPDAIAFDGVVLLADIDPGGPDTPEQFRVQKKSLIVDLAAARGDRAADVLATQVGFAAMVAETDPYLDRPRVELFVEPTLLRAHEPLLRDFGLTLDFWRRGRNLEYSISAENAQYRTRLLTWVGWLAAAHNEVLPRLDRLHGTGPTFGPDRGDHPQARAR